MGAGLAPCCSEAWPGSVTPVRPLGSAILRDVPETPEIQPRDKTDALLNSVGALAEPVQALTHHNPLSSYRRRC